MDSHLVRPGQTLTDVHRSLTVQRAVRDPWPALMALGHRGLGPWRQATAYLVPVAGSVTTRRCTRLRQPASRLLQLSWILRQHSEPPPLQSMQLPALPVMSVWLALAPLHLLVWLISRDIAALRATFVTAPLSQVLLLATSGRCSRQSRVQHAHLVQQGASVALEEQKRQGPAQQVLIAQRVLRAQPRVLLVPTEHRVEERRSEIVLPVAQASTASFLEAAQQLGLAKQAFFAVLGQPLQLLGHSFGGPKFQPLWIQQRARRSQLPQEQQFQARLLS